MTVITIIAVILAIVAFIALERNQTTWDRDRARRELEQIRRDQEPK